MTKQYNKNKTIKIETNTTRLNKYISNSGLCARREADQYIKRGWIKVNGKVITELGVQIKDTDDVFFKDKILKNEKKVYLLLNKPKDFLTTVHDPKNDKTVMQLVKNACVERIYPVGRLDKMTTGLLLFTNDGETAKRLTHPKYEKKKIYHIFLHTILTQYDLHKIEEGIKLEDGLIKVDKIAYPDPKDKTQVGIEIHSGRNRIVRRIFEHFGYRIKKLDRVYYAGLIKKGLSRGEWRLLTELEIKNLVTGAYE